MIQRFSFNEFSNLGSGVNMAEGVVKKLINYSSKVATQRGLHDQIS